MKPFVRFIRICSIVALGVAAAPFFGCAEVAPPESTQSEAVSKSSEAAHHGGVERLVSDALAELKLRPEQQAEIEKIGSEFKTRHEPVKAAKRELMVALADQIDNGEIDRCALDPQITKVGSAVAKAHPGDRAAFERLHAILDPDQRAKFVEALGRRWKMLEKVHEPRVMTEAIAKELKLSSDQKTRLEKIFAGLREIKEAGPTQAARKERWGKVLEAFKGDRFVLDELVPAKDVEAEAADKIERLLWAGEAILPVLNVEQRTQVAKMLRDKGEDGDTGKAPTSD
ncbi:MAG TPA: Spy/CpxP family protein refolding chaperone [Labilithrix sp.]|nr:Spy/CpxP family protein refolding chaperone [Labilithrix sp.]